MRLNSIRPFVLIITFATAYTVAVLLIGVLPVNSVLVHFYPERVGALWRASALQLLATFSLVGITGTGLLFFTHRLTGRLTSELLWLRTLLGGALGGALDVTLGRLLVHRVVFLHYTWPMAAVLCKMALSLWITVVVMLVLVVRVTSAHTLTPLGETCDTVPSEEGN